MTRLGVGIFRDAGLCTFGPCCAYCEWAPEQRGLRGTFRPWPTRQGEGIGVMKKCSVNDYRKSKRSSKI